MTAGRDLVPALARIVGAAHVLTDPAVTVGHSRDWTGRWQGQCALVVRPGSADEAAAVLAATATVGAHVVLQGGNTGLVGGAVPEGDDVVLSTTRLADVGPVDATTATVTADAGVTLARLQEHVRRHGLELPVDLAARDTATLGGMAATNAGGVRVLRDGPMRAHVLAVDALDAAGRPLARLRELVKDNTGYSMSGLLVGSEGTLGLVTRLLLRLVPLPADRACAVVGVTDVTAAADTVGRVRHLLPDLRAAEVVDATALGLLADAGTPSPLGRPHGALLLLECAGAAGQLDTLAAALTSVGLADADAAVADDPAGVRALWQVRHGVTEAVARAGVPHKLDVSLPTGRVADVLAAVRDITGDRRLAVFGHVGDGNLHLNVLDADPADDELDRRVLTVVAAAGGSISAEHGIGRAKAALLPLARTTDEVAALRAVKDALDPRNRLGRALFPPAHAGTG